MLSAVYDCMSLIIALLGLLSVAWTAYELGRMSHKARSIRAWDRKGRPLRVEVVD